MVLEEEQGSRSKATHIAIPAAYSSGVTIFALQSSSLGSELFAAPELQLFWQRKAKIGAKRDLKDSQKSQFMW